MEFYRLIYRLCRGGPSVPSVHETLVTTFSSCKIQENLSVMEVLWKFLKRGSF